MAAFMSDVAQFRAVGILVIAFAITACEPAETPVDPQAHRAAVEAWREKRVEKLTRPDGWLTLVGLFWMKHGNYSLGGDSSNNFAYAGVNNWVPPRVGTFRVQDSTVHFDAEPGVQVLVKGEPIRSFDALPAEGPAPVFELGSLQWFVITRSGEYAVRMRDAESPVRTAFISDDIPLFPISTDWRLSARFEWKDPPDTVEIPNILGTVNRTPSPASARFTVAGKTYRLVLWKDSDDTTNFFTAFADETNVRETYGGGRFLWIDAPDAEGRTVVDFNRAYNPPCVFTEFATCPLPPPENRLSFAVPAGEKAYRKH